MKLRVAKLSTGKFVIQRRCCFFWWVLAVDVTNQEFSDFHEAWAIAKAEKRRQRGFITEAWRV